MFRPIRVRAAGFTLVELLVVIAIIGLLIALLLPAIQACREAARRSQCSNNLAQLGIALHLYEDAHQVFPPGTMDKKGPIRSEPIGYHLSWLTQILPYIEEQNTFKHINFSVGAYSLKNAAVEEIQIPTFECPSDGRLRPTRPVWQAAAAAGTTPGAGEPGPPAEPSVSPAGPPGMDDADPATAQIAGGVSTRPPGVSNYAGCHHDVEAPIDHNNHGVFFLNSRIRPRDVTDGLSHTLFVAEKTVDEEDLGWMSGTRSTLRNTGTPPNMKSAPPGLGTSASSQYDPAMPSPAPGAAPFPAGGGDSQAQKAADAKRLLEVGGYSSNHPGGVMALLGSGSVCFLSDNLTMTTYQQLGHRSDGKLIQERH